MKHDLIPRVVSKLLIPFILLFGLYVQFHGDYGPGGGFQAGVIFAAAFILYALVFGLESARRMLPLSFVSVLVAVGLMIFAGVGFLSLFVDANYLDYTVLGHDPVHGQHRGIFWVELGVGITVSAVMVTIFYMFAGRGRN